MPQAQNARFVVGIDTCGPSGSVALGGIAGESVEILGQIELEGRNYSATLVAAVAELLAHAGVELKRVGAIVAVNGPGSFTGVRVGLSAAKGLAEAGQIPVVAVSRLEVLAWKAGVDSAALDAHRHEVFLRLAAAGGTARELVAGPEELAALRPTSGQIAACDEAAAALLNASLPAIQLVRTTPPTAADALKLCGSRVVEADFVDIALLDGNYLRRSDAEIFGEAAKAQSG